MTPAAAANLAGLAVWVVLFLGSLWLLMDKRKRKADPVPQLRAKLQAALHQAECDSLAAVGARGHLRALLHRHRALEWEVAFHGTAAAAPPPPAPPLPRYSPGGWIPSPTSLASMERNLPRLQQAISQYARQVQHLDTAQAATLAEARLLQRQLAKHSRPARTRQQPDLAVLAQVCWQGWLARSGKAC